MGCGALGRAAFVNAPKKVWHEQATLRCYKIRIDRVGHISFNSWEGLWGSSCFGRGDTYLQRLWCVVELFIFVQAGGKPDAICVRRLALGQSLGSEFCCRGLGSRTLLKFSLKLLSMAATFL